MNIPLERNDHSISSNCYDIASTFQFEKEILIILWQQIKIVMQ